MNLYFNTYKNPFKLDQTLDGLYPADDADFPIRFSFGSDYASRPLVNEVMFGDGYGQRAAAGIVKQSLDLKLIFTNRRDEVVTALRRFFEGDRTSTIYNRDPDEYFYIALPPPYSADITQAVPRKFVVNSFAISPVTWNSSTVTVAIKEWFGY